MPPYTAVNIDTVANKLNVDKDDEAMVKWKQSLLTAGGKDLSDPSDPRTCIIQSLALEVGFIHSSDVIPKANLQSTG